MEWGAVSNLRTGGVIAVLIFCGVTSFHVVASSVPGSSPYIPEHETDIPLGDSDVLSSLDTTGSGTLHSAPAPQEAIEEDRQPDGDGRLTAERGAGAEVPSTKRLVGIGVSSALASALFYLLSRGARQASENAWFVWEEARPATAYATVAEALLAATLFSAIGGASAVAQGVHKRRQEAKRRRREQLRKEAHASLVEDRASVTATSDTIPAPETADGRMPELELVEENRRSWISPTQRSRVTHKPPGNAAVASTLLLGLAAAAGGAGVTLQRRQPLNYSSIEGNARKNVVAGLFFGTAAVSLYHLFRQLRARRAAARNTADKA
ncbi:hypothetical protein BESB_005750 [Besnoitia besnoiti]|uniref:Transmembrane protein n=1 Tax=Besnoitia besnoiti TaxID=94643 RepID=A0A2A9MLS8_BESBE|nr:hypothetical protein BESB_005750 [Besnoitia besnoiti]PFH38234.1 hypothetical protein BESB_005750 [Besnoitia besnoiti]